MVVEKLVDEITPLNLEDKEFLFDILKSRLIEERRKSIYNNYENDIKEYENDNVKKGSVNKLFKALK